MIDFILNRIKLKIFRHKWRLKNSHNFTKINSIFPIEKVSVGKMTYGLLNINNFGHNSEKLIIGNFVSIASNVNFLLGGNHRTDTLFCYPIYSKYISTSPNHDALTKGSIIVEDDVWIGSNAIILSGVTLGKGTIVAAGSVVVKSTQAYSIVGGNPAMVIKMRFDENIISSLISIDFNKLKEEKVVALISLLYEPLTLEKLNYLKQELF